MKHKILAICILLLMSASAFAERTPGRDMRPAAGATIDFGTYIDANLILMFVTNKGSFAFDNGALFGKNDGLYYPYTGLQNILDGKNNTTAIFAGSIWIGAIDGATGDTLITSGQHDTDWSMGPLDASGNPPPGNEAVTNTAYKVYKLYADSMADNPNDDYLNWPVDQGAPVDEFGNPELIGDHMCWSVYNDMDATAHSHSQGSVGQGLGLEVRQTAFAFAREGALANIVFVRFRIYNKSGIDLENMMVSVWSDPDLGDAGDDFVACDVPRSLGYCYNDGDDSNYGSRPPAVGYDFFQGPLIFTGDDADTAKMWGQIWPQFINLGMTSFNKYINGTDPDTPVQTWSYMNGLNAEDAADIKPLIDPTTGLVTTYFGNGDPVTGTGWIDANSSDRRWMQTTGPFDFPPGDSTEIVVAVVMGQGSSPLNSISVLRQIDDFAQSVYDDDFVLPDPPARPDVTVTNLDREVVLTWGTKSEDESGEYPFEGYALMQGPTSNGPWSDTLMWADLINEHAGVLDIRFDLQAGQDLPYLAKPGSNDGLQHFFSTKRDATGGGNLVNYREYYYRLEAYSVDTSMAPGQKTLTSATILTVMPQSPLTGTDINAESGTEITVSYANGPDSTAPGRAEAFVVNPALVTGDDYAVMFSKFWVDALGDTITENVWHVVNTTTGDTVVYAWSNQSDADGKGHYPIADGIQVKVYGPPPSVELFQVVANAGGPVDPPVAGAVDFQGFPTGFDATGTPLRPGPDQQVGPGTFAFHTADNGGSCGGGTRGSFDAWNARATRDGGNLQVIADFDYEMRFTGDVTNPGVNGSYAIEAFVDDNVFWVPFELWNIGVNTPSDPSDDVRLVPLAIDDGEDNTYNFENWGCNDGTGVLGVDYGGGGEHSGSGGDNDPWTDWIYWYTPTDMSPGEAGYLANEADMVAGTYDYAFLGDEVFARTVIMNWNGGITPPFDQDMVEQGTVFRISTAKPNAPTDSYLFSTAGMGVAMATSGNADLLDNIRTVPNPYYLFSEYDPSGFNRRLKFTNLPAECTISIYNLAGDMVSKLEKEDAASTELFWDMLNASGVPVGSGIYIYVVDAPNFGQKIGKMAVFTEVELLDQF